MFCLARWTKHGVRNIRTKGMRDVRLGKGWGWGGGGDGEGAETLGDV